MAIERIKLNLIPTGKMPVCHASQYDKGRRIALDIYNGLQPYILSDEMLELDIRKSDGRIVTLDVPITARGNSVVFSTTEQMCAVAGANLCELKITKGADVIGSLNFYMEIERSPMENGLQSDSEINNLTTQIAGILDPMLDEKIPPVVEEILPQIIGDNYPTKTEVENALATKANSNDVYDKQTIDAAFGSVDNALANKADSANVYSKNEVDNVLATKANSSDVYTKIQIDNAMDLKADKTEITELNGAIALNGIKHLNGTKINAYIAASTGKITSGNNYRTKYIAIEAGKGYRFYSTGNRLIYGFYYSVDINSAPYRNIYYSDNDHASTEHYIYNGIGALYLVIYYNQGADDTVDAIVYEDSAVKDNHDDIERLNDLYFKDEALIEGIVQKGFIGNTGLLNNGVTYRNKFYCVEPNKTYKISASGNRLFAGFYSSTATGAAADYWTKADKNDTIYLKNTNSPYLVVYYYNGSSEPTTEDAFVYLVKDDPLMHLNICIFGNSYAADAWGYVPFILKKYGITTNIYMYYRGSGSPSRLVAEWEDTSDTGLDIYGSPHIRRMTHIDTRTMSEWEDAVSGFSAKNILEFANDNTKNIGEWDIITLQLVSSEQYPDGQGGYTMKNGIEPALRQVINLINASYTKNYCLGFFETYNRIKSIGGIPIEELDDRIETMRANEAAYRAEPFGLLLPVGAAVFSARTNGLLASLDVSDIGNLWSTDKTHLQEGLPCYIAALTICQALFNKYGLPFSVIGDDTRITSALIDSWNVQFQNGTPKEVGELYYQLGQKCAVVANDSPFDITPIYAPTDNDEVIYDRSKYWADSLIDTSNIT